MLELLSAPPRFSTQRLDITVAPVDPDSPHGERLGHVLLRVFTADPFEGEREEDEWVFAANRLEPEHVLVVNISFGYAEIEAERSSWESVLTRAVGRALALWDSQPDLVETGHLATSPIAGSLPEPIDVGTLEFHATGWAAANLAIAMDMAEIDTGVRAWRRIVSEPDEPDVSVEGCPACEGESLLLVDTTVGHVESLCDFHAHQHGSEQSDFAITGDGFSMTGKILITSLPMPGNPIASGFTARALDAWDADVDRSRAFLDWILNAFADHPEVFEQLVDADRDLDAVFQSVDRVTGDNPEEGLRYAEALADMAGSEHRWLFEIAALKCMRELDRQPDADAMVSDWLERAGSQPYLYLVAGDHLLDWGRYEEAMPPLWKLYGHAVMSGNQSDATYALSHLARACSELGRSPEAAELRARLVLVESNGLASLRPGRNDPCPCGSGRKSKRCCGRPVSSIRH